jgi:thioredoxin 1
MVLLENTMAKLKPHGVNMKKIMRFTASWCQPCKAMAKNLENADLGIDIEVVDIDVHTDLAVEYMVRSVPTLILKDGSSDRRLVGVKSAQEIKDWVNA